MSQTDDLIPHPSDPFRLRARCLALGRQCEAQSGKTEVDAAAAIWDWIHEGDNLAERWTAFLVAFDFQGVRRVELILDRAQRYLTFCREPEALERVAEEVATAPAEPRLTIDDPEHQQPPDAVPAEELPDEPETTVTLEEAEERAASDPDGRTALCGKELKNPHAKTAHERICRKCSEIRFEGRVAAATAAP